MKKILILGAGNMVDAFFGKSVVNFKDIEISIASPSNVSSLKFAETYGVKFLPYEEIFNHDFDTYILGMKPQVFEDISGKLSSNIAADRLIISILAGVDTRKLSDVFKTNKVIRLMPNTPSSVAMGVCPIYATSSIEESILDIFKLAISVTGFIFFVDNEDKLDKITPYTGSGPAYFFEFARIFTQKLIEDGIDDRVARESIAMTMKGSAQLILESRESLETLRDNVTSKKGVTFEALEEMKDHKLVNILRGAIDRAHKRVVELKKGR